MNDATIYKIIGGFQIMVVLIAGIIFSKIAVMSGYKYSGEILVIIMISVVYLVCSIIADYFIEED